MRIHALILRCLPSAILLVGSLGGSITLLAGCGGESGGEKAKETEATPSSQADTREKAESNPEKPPAAGALSAIRVDAEGHKYFGKVPLDVFFADPLRTASDDRPIALAENGAPDGVTPPIAVASDPAGTPNEPDAQGSDGEDLDWSKVIAAEPLDAEVKKIINRLNQKLQTVGSYNSSHLELPPHIHTLAALTGVATQHPADILWKDKARFIRDLSGQMGKETLQRGAKSYKTLQIPFEQITVLMSGSEPVGLPDSPETRPFSDVADRGRLMERMKIGFDWLKVNATSDDSLKESREDIIREASVLAALGKVIAEPNYLFADFDDFVGFSDDLVEGSRQMVLATESENFAEFDKGINRVYKACNECHQGYR